jgi:hypothetical protein
VLLLIYTLEMWGKIIVQGLVMHQVGTAVAAVVVWPPLENRNAVYIIVFTLALHYLMESYAWMYARVRELQGAYLRNGWNVLDGAIVMFCQVGRVLADLRLLPLFDILPFSRLHLPN